MESKLAKRGLSMFRQLITATTLFSNDILYLKICSTLVVKFPNWGTYCYFFMERLCIYDFIFYMSIN